ncbi:hypothetical protein BJX61DRAFT_545802 [Aspergillus egyptiacus]|nr:hypothetical protein BJX61DRAFT_545802 [Aspergillus egyptiacus]
MKCKAPPDCTNLAPRTLQANPDVSGIGVVIGFLATAWATLLFLIVHYVAVPSESTSHLLDLPLRRAIQKALHWNPKGGWDEPLRRVVLAMSDQQLVTGIAILIGGYSQLHCALSLYHWQIITTLTWFSTTTHLASLPFLQQYLRKHRYIFYLRVLLMCGLAIMLGIGLLPTGNIYLTAPAKCFFDAPHLGANHETVFYITVSEIILFGTLLTRLVRMFPTSRNISGYPLKFVRKFWRNSIVWLCKKLQGSPRLVGMILAPPAVFSLVALVLAQAFLDIMRSGAFEVLWLLFSLIWGTIRLFTVRDSLPQHFEATEEEDRWGFGQLVPVLMLLIPVLLIAESWSGTSTSLHRPLYAANLAEADFASRNDV